MNITPKIRLQHRFQNTLFVVLITIVMGLLAWLSIHYSFQSDWTLNQRHTLSEVSIQLLAKLPEPVAVTVYASANKELREPIEQLMKRYQHYKENLTLHFIDPYTVPAEVRQRNIQVDGEILIEYQTRTEHIQKQPHYVSEQDVTSALQRVARSHKSYLFFLEGHGERSSTNAANHDVSEWAQELTQRGFEVKPLNLGHSGKIPEETNILVIANPQVQLLPAEVTLLTTYLEQGGNLLWLLDPAEPLQGLEPLAEKLGLTVQPGQIVEPNTLLYQIDKPTLVVLSPENYAFQHPILAHLTLNTLFPYTSGLIVNPPENWQATVLLTSSEQAWSETTEEMEYNEGVDIGGPLNLAYALNRDKEQKPLQSEKIEPEITKQEVMDEHEHDESGETSAQQRIILVGDGDFLSNTYLRNGGNLNLGMKMIDWLVQEHDLIDIPSKVAPDTQLELSANQMIFLGIVFLFLLPFSLIGTGIIIWLRRRNA